jgi:hypothetical protein
MTAMTHAFPEFPHLPGIQSQRPFSLPQQTYLQAQFLLEQCKGEAQRWLEGDYSAEELKRMGSLEMMDHLDAYRDQLGYDEALEMVIEAKKHLIEWGFEQLRRGSQMLPAAEILAKRTLILKRPLLREQFVEICMGMIPREP